MYNLGNENPPWYEELYLGGKRATQTRLVRGVVRRIVRKGEDVIAFVQTEAYPRREFRVFLARPKSPFGSQRKIEVRKNRELPVVTLPVDLHLEIGTQVLFGTPVPGNDLVTPIVRGSQLDRAKGDLLVRYGGRQFPRKGQHIFPPA